ncbi:MAG: hypothetical protein B6U87_02745 [Candidatus Aenigmarchaeota archaeon ex4484_52]|nr:MAG: hypothetical protein B6U87_02745 [Candidatus Aenigmarchaeota archaeon ex4484_52]
MPVEINPVFLHKKYLFRKKFLKLFGAEFYVYDESKHLVFYSKQKAFKLKEDFRIYSNENQTKELLRIKTPEIFDIGATYSVFDTSNSENIGAIKRQAIKSFFKDEWIFLSNDKAEIGKLTEKSTTGALLSRIIRLIPQQYVILANNRIIAKIRRHFNPFILKYTLEINPEPIIDRRLLISAVILLCGIEGREG